MGGKAIVGLLLTLVVSFISFSGCSDSDPLGPRVHPSSWMVPASQDFHGRRVASYGIDFCESCHGADLRGGERAVSCYDCHALLGTCSGCHGRVMWDFAPPPDLSGNTETDAIGVGAHLYHVNPSLLADGYDCSQCHVKPTELASPGHMDDGIPAELTFGPLASADGASPAWDRAAPSCSGTYCHGATLEGGAQTSPLWTDFPPEEELCGTCHPIQDMIQGSHAPHIAHGFDCSYCHEGYSTDAVLTSIHVNGTRDVILPANVGGSYSGRTCSGVHCHGEFHTTPLWGEDVDFQCYACHGEYYPGLPDSLQGAPPPDLSGDTSTADREVGAHERHVVAGMFRVSLDCSECHVKPSQVDSPGHADPDLVADVEFGDLARTDDASPLWDTSDPASLKCSGVYCHGATHVGGTNTVPLWTVVDGSQVYCGSCHQIPPHEDRGPCYLCHGNVVSADTTITDFGKTLHVNGEIDF